MGVCCRSRTISSAIRNTAEVHVSHTENKQKGIETSREHALLEDFVGSLRGTVKGESYDCSMP
eukprot:2640134-Prorocentrum_lima.AAC.1